MDKSAESNNICFSDATTLAKKIADKDLSSMEVMSSFYQQINTYNPQINAICTLIPEEDALELAVKADMKTMNGAKPGPLHGLPIAVKDLSLTKNIRTTFGSKVFENNVPDTDSLLVQRLKKAGAIIIGKTNTPEFGAGSNTFNEVFGVTKNPYDLTKTAGGSSGGAAAAISSGMLPLADGSDMGGSLRNPAAYCNVVGFRPSIGRVPSWPSSTIWHDRLGVEGPIGRTVQDCALLLSAIAGPDARDSLSIQQPAEQFLQSLDADHRAVRIGWTPDLGMLPVEDEIRRVCTTAVSSFEQLGCNIDEALPDLSGAMDIFKVLRANIYGTLGKTIPQEKFSLLKETLRQNMKLGFSLSADDVSTAEMQRTKLMQRFLSFFEKYDFLLLPSTQVQPFDHTIEWVDNIAGVSLTNYVDWMSICSIITLFGLPAISVPCGFTKQGLPVGIQIVGKPKADLEVLKLANSFESIDNWHRQHPHLTNQD